MDPLWKSRSAHARATIKFPFVFQHSLLFDLNLYAAQLRLELLVFSVLLQVVCVGPRIEVLVTSL